MVGESSEVNSKECYWWRSAMPSTVFVARLWFEAKEMAATIGGNIMNMDAWESSSDLPVAAKVVCRNHIDGGIWVVGEGLAGHLHGSL